MAFNNDIHLKHSSNNLDCNSTRPVSDIPKKDRKPCCADCNQQCSKTKDSKTPSSATTIDANTAPAPSPTKVDLSW